MLIWTRKKNFRKPHPAQEVSEAEEVVVEDDEDLVEAEPMEIPEADLSATVVKRSGKKV